ncbi:UDP-2,4-diacetamido-2,4,6-trideoxy-beta-L-altropyranose hydrolase [Chitinibacter sp. S2-10]|uniref:UDP-2,4-diacetamido-2,4, 6-trideoxy-beta-L-altropyranose hydrolase n=1 Tax=Chitinibacter sp. S2-10 TaxID=3373597 RepID=UPI0039777BCF
MKILIRTDASSTIGLGHVSRCLTLARALLASIPGIEIHFACSELPGNFVDGVLAQGFYVISLPGQYPVFDGGAEIQSELAILAAHLTSRYDWCIVDHYGLGRVWESAMRQHAERILVIDDLCNRPHDADIVLNQNLAVVPADYLGQVPADCRCLTGPKYALLRPEFTGEVIAIKPGIERILVNFGGADPTREMFKVIEALVSLPPVSVDFVAGASNPAFGELQARVATCEHWSLHRHVEDFAGLMRQADLFIGAAGSSSWERAAMGLPSVAIAVAENQLPNAQGLARLGAHAYLGCAAEVSPEQITGQLRGIDWQQRQDWARISHQLVDAKGCERVIAALLLPGLQIRRVEQADSKLLFDARNSPEIREVSLNSEPISWEGHCAWLERCLANPHCILLLADAADGPVGVVRFDRADDLAEIADISIYLLPHRLGLGWGSGVLAAAQAFMQTQWLQVSRIRAVIKNDNQASLALFRQAGFRLQSTEPTGSIYICAIKGIDLE